MSDVSKISSSNIVKIGSILNIQIYTAKCQFLTTKKGASNYLTLKIVFMQKSFFTIEVANLFEVPSSLISYNQCTKSNECNKKTSTILFNQHQVNME